MIIIIMCLHRSSIFQEVVNDSPSAAFRSSPPLVPRVPVCLLSLPYEVYKDLQVSFFFAGSRQKCLEDLIKVKTCSQLKTLRRCCGAVV